MNKKTIYSLKYLYENPENLVIEVATLASLINRPSYTDLVIAFSETNEVKLSDDYKGHRIEAIMCRERKDIDIKLLDFNCAFFIEADTIYDN